MATATRTDPTREVLDTIKGLDARLTKQESAIDGLLKAVQEPASKAGVSPKEFLQAVSKKDGVVAFGADGFLNPRYTKSRKKNILGAAERADGGKGSFGDFLKSFHDFHDQNLGYSHREKSFQSLKAYGTEMVSYQGDKEVLVKTALAESSAVTGGYTVPPMFEQQLFELAIEGAVVQPRARKYPLTARTLQIPALDQTNTSNTATAGQSNLLGGVVASWTAEAATRQEAEPLFRQVVLTAWELSFYALASNTLLADNAVGLDALLTQLFGQAIGWYTDYAYLQGSGVGQPLGLLNAPASLTVTRQTSSHFTFQDVVNMIGKLYWMMRNSKSLCWVIHQSVIPDLMRLNDESGGANFTGSLNAGRVLWIPFNEGLRDAIPESAGVQSIGTLAGWPVLVSEKMAPLGTQGDVGLFDLDKYALGERMDMEIMVSPHVKFLNNQMAWRIVWRGDGQPLLNKAVTLADGSQTVSAYLILH